MAIEAFTARALDALKAQAWGARTAYHAVFVDVAEVGIRIVSELCHMPPKPRSNTVVYGSTPMHIVVAGSR